MKTNTVFDSETLCGVSCSAKLHLHLIELFIDWVRELHSYMHLFVIDVSRVAVYSSTIRRHTNRVHHKHILFSLFSQQISTDFNEYNLHRDVAPPSLRFQLITARILNTIHRTTVNDLQAATKVSPSTGLEMSSHRRVICVRASLHARRYAKWSIHSGPTLQWCCIIDVIHRYKFE